MVCATMKIYSSTMHSQITCPKLLRAMKKLKSSSELTKLFVGKQFPISKLKWQMEPPSAAEQEPCPSQPLTSMCQGHGKCGSADSPPKLASLPILVTGTFLSRARSLSCSGERGGGKTKQEIHKLTGHMVKHLQKVRAQARPPELLHAVESLP